VEARAIGIRCFSGKISGICFTFTKHLWGHQISQKREREREREKEKAGFDSNYSNGRSSVSSAQPLIVWQSGRRFRWQTSADSGAPSALEENSK